MTQQVDFYLLKAGEDLASDRLLSRLCEKAGARGHHIYIHVNDSNEAQRLDDYLWAYKDSSFLSHTRAPDLAEHVPITLGFTEPLSTQHDILINLSDAIPTFSAKFKRVIHIVPADDTQRARSREHYRTYQAEGSTLQTHDI